jgi:hypothetical protein
MNRLQSNDRGLEMSMVTNRFLTQLMPHPRLLDAAERDGEVENRVRVDPNRSCTEVADEEVCPIETARLYARAKTELRVVRTSEHIFNVAEPGYCQNGTENLFLDDAHVRCDVRQDRGTYVRSRSRQGPSSGYYTGAQLPT